MDSLKKQLIDIEKLIDQADKLSPKISKKPVGWHLEHCLLILSMISKRVAEVDPKTYKKPGFNISRSLIFAFGKIPRKMGRAPKNTRPEGGSTPEQLRDMLKKAEQDIQLVSQQHQHSYFEHPYWGHIARDKVERFMQIHTNHHISIAKDIVKKSR